MKHQNLIVDLLVNNLILTSQTTLDAILSGIIYQYTEDAKKALDLSDYLTFSEHYNVWQASTIMFPEGFKTGDKTITKSMSLAYEQLGIENYNIENIEIKELNNNDTLYSAKTTNQDKAILSQKFNTYPSIIANVNKSRNTTFLCRGDKNKIEEALAYATYIGKKRNIGFGKIHNIKITESKSLSDDYGIMSGDKLLRPIPLSSQCDAQNSYRTVGRCIPPYSTSLSNKYGFDIEPILVPLDEKMMTR